MDILDQSIDDAVADFILKQLDDYKAKVDEHVTASTSDLEEQYQAKQKKLFAFAEQQIAEQVEAVKEEYSARMVAKLQEKNEYIAELEESTESFKDTLADRVNTFLANSKDEVRSLVEEEMRLDVDNLNATRVLDEIKAIIGVVSAPVVSEDNTKLARLEEDLEVLKERITSKTQSNQKLNAKLRVFELVESLPAADRGFFIEQLSDIETVEEADERFNSVKTAIRNAKVELLEEQLGESESRGVVDEEETDHSPTTSNDDNSTLDRMKYLAGI